MQMICSHTSFDRSSPSVTNDFKAVYLGFIAELRLAKGLAGRNRRTYCREISDKTHSNQLVRYCKYTTVRVSLS